MQGHAGGITSDVRTFIIILKNNGGEGGGENACISPAVKRTSISLDAFSDESVLKSIDVRQRRLRLLEVRIDFLFFFFFSPPVPLCPCCVFLEWKTQHCIPPTHPNRVNGRMQISIFNISERRSRAAGCVERRNKRWDCNKMTRHLLPQLSGQCFFFSLEGNKKIKNK